MSEVRRAIGGRIRLYRQLKQYTLVELAQKIHKSKATLSKYEIGEISLDVETLLEIARALEVRPQQLLDSGEVSTGSASLRVRQSDFFRQKRICVYFYDGRAKKIIRSILELGEEETDPTAAFFYDLPSIEKPEECRNLYYGTVEYFDTVTNFSFSSQSNRIERLSLFAANPFERGEEVKAMLSGLSRRFMLPVSICCLLSAVPLKETEELKDRLKLSQAELRRIRQTNMFLSGGSFES